MSEVTVTHKPARMMEGSFEIRVGGSLVGFTKDPEVAAKIGAVDELLEALRRCAARFDEDDVKDSPELVADVDAAIAKAEGKV